eukprot:scaffold11076_cov122-Cylindrotheca_fusiformis.AAC.3
MNEYESADEVDEEVESSEEEVVAKKRRTKKWKDPNKPKRAMSAFFLYSQENRARVKEENPDASFGDVVSQFVLVSPAGPLQESFCAN